MATITVATLALVSDISAIASRMAGIDISPSLMRMTMGSSQRIAPPSMPTTVPISTDSAATVTPICIETRPPWMVRLKVSRP